MASLALGSASLRGGCLLGPSLRFQNTSDVPLRNLAAVPGSRMETPLADTSFLRLIPPMNDPKEIFAHSNQPSLNLTPNGASTA